jgi:hypothetical protein
MVIPTMSDVSELEAKQIAAAFRPGRRRSWIFVSLHIVTISLILGLPYFRGRRLAAAERTDFTSFSRCLIGGAPAEHPGLALPRGDRENFAAHALFAPASWPASCRPALQRLAPEPAIFLWPSVKQASGDLRATVDLMERELQTLIERRRQPLGRVPQRPLEALKRVQAASVLLARAAGVDADVDNDALTLDPNAPGLAKPARLPLMAGDTSTLEIWTSPLALTALGLDGHGLSYLRLADGKIDHARVKRTSYVRGVTRAGDTPYVVWAMPEARCLTREDHCVGRPTGLAPLDWGGHELGDPTWKLSEHVGARLDRALYVNETGKLELLARDTPEGTLAFTQFRLPPHDPSRAVDPKAAPLEPERRVLIGATPVDSAVLLPGEPSAVLAARASEEGVSASLVWASDGVPPLPLMAASGTGPWTAACQYADQRYLAYGSSSQLRLARALPLQTLIPLAEHALPLGAAIDPENAALDKVRVICSAEGVRALYLSEQHELWQISCAADGCSEPRSLAQSVYAFSALLDGGSSVVAYSGGPLAPIIRVIRFDARGSLESGPLTPGACWEPLGGMCGTPVLQADAAQRIVLLAHDGGDLLGLESSDGGRSFGTLSGLVTGTSFESSTTSPLKQHRLRKGIE